MKPWAELDGLRCSELAELIKKVPVVYVPNGIYEWHDEQNPMGLDTIKIVDMAKRAARLTGGAVHMPLYVGAGAFYGKTGPLKHGGINFEEGFVKEFLITLYEQLEALGFELIVVLYGHTNIENINAHELSAVEYMQRQDTHARVFVLCDGAPIIKHAANKVADHAAKWETSFMLAICPDRVDMEAIDPNHGPWHGLDPRVHASAAAGEFALAKGGEEVARLVEYAAGLTREELIDYHYKADTPCWEDCQNIRDLETDYWKGDFRWEDPSCPFCLFRTPGVVKKLEQLKGRAWVDRRMEQYRVEFSAYKKGTRMRKSVDEILEEAA